MAGPRLLSPAAKQLAAGARQQTRQLHMTGAAPYASRFLTSSKPIAIVPKQTVESESKRNLNTSRTLKSVNDTSTIDFTFLPEESAMAESAEDVRVPKL